MTAALLVVATAAVVLAAVRYKHGVLLAVGVGIAAHYTYRSVVLDHGLDDPSPAYLFSSVYDAPFQRVDLLLLLWLLVLLGTTSIVRRRRDSLGSAIATPNLTLPILWPIVAIVICSSVLLIVSKEGIAATQRFARLGNEGQGGTGIFVAAPAVLLVASIIRFRGSPPRSGAQVMSLLGMGLACGTFWALGSRTPIIAAITAFILAALLTMAERKKISLRIVAIVTIAAITLPVLAVGLSTQRRAALTQGSVEVEASFSESINAIYYDAFALAARDSGETIGELGPGLFLDRSLSIVPRALWDDKPELLSVGKWLRREYEPQVINGWPVGAPGDWYLALGLVGVIVGAVLSGLLANSLDRWGQKMGSLGSPRPYFELSVFWGFVLLPGGIDSDIVSRGIIWVVLPLLYVRIFSVPAAAKSSTSLRPLGGGGSGRKKAGIHHRNA